MEHARKDDDEVTELARSLDCLTEADLAKLAGASPMTVQAWRKRHIGPDYILIGRRFLYPREPLKAFLLARVRRMGAKVDPRAVL